MRFVVRMHPDVHTQLALITRGVYSGGELSGETLLAFSTYFHETIHWWQHVGSTLGLILSLCYPAQAHVNHRRLMWLVEKIGPVKSLRTFREDSTGLDPGVERELNIVLNNWHDIEYCRRIALAPQFAKQITKERYFDSIGHQYAMTWGSCVAVITASVDPEFRYLANVMEWEDEFHAMRLAKIEGYHRDSRVFLVGTGARLIFEGQARFDQLQYLHQTSDDMLTWDGFRARGMLGDDYTAAFKQFLELLKIPWPEDITGPEVALFLALCDIALNPGEGFPFTIRRFETFIEDVDPGFRFFRLCIAARPKKEELFALVEGHSRSGYVEVAKTLCEDLAWRSPMEISQNVENWASISPEAAAIAEEHRLFRFSVGDLPVRLFMGQFMAFQRAKNKYPEFFVWPGFHMANRQSSPLADELVMELFAQHEPLFTATAEGEIRPTLIPGRTEADIYETFNAFYSWSASYDLTRQWHVDDGPFSFDFGWITPTASQQDMRLWASKVFQTSFGFSPDDFTVL